MNAFRAVSVADSLAATQSLCHISESRLGVFRIIQIVCHLLIVEHELSCLALDVVSSLGNGEGYDLDVFVGNLVEDLFLFLNAPI